MNMLLKTTLLILLITFSKAAFCIDPVASKNIDQALENIRKTHNIPALSVSIVEAGSTV